MRARYITIFSEGYERIYCEGYKFGEIYINCIGKKLEARSQGKRDRF